MSGTLMLVNPRARKRRKNPSKKRRSAAQIAATRKLVALNRGKNPVRKLRRRRSHSARARNPIMSHVRRYVSRRRRRNPIQVGFTGKGAISMIKSGALGAGGALTVDLVMGYLPLPPNLMTRTNPDGSTNFLYFGTKAVFAMALGVFGRRLLGSNAVEMAQGAMVVNVYDLFRTMMPAGLRLGYFNPAMIAKSAPGMKAYIPGRPMGAYVQGQGTMRPTNVTGNVANTVGMAGVRQLNRGGAFGR